MSKAQARSTVKAVNRAFRRGAFAGWADGGRAWGVDWSTWCVTFPHVASVYNEAAEVLTGRRGRFIPPSA